MTLGLGSMPIASSGAAKKMGGRPMGVMPLGPLVRLIGLSRLLASTRITSPKPSVTRAR